MARKGKPRKTAEALWSNDENRDDSAVTDEALFLDDDEYIDDETVHEWGVMPLAGPRWDARRALELVREQQWLRSNLEDFDDYVL